MTTFNGIIEPLAISTGSSGSLAGLTFVAKDLFDVAGYTTGAGNPDWKKTHSTAAEHAEAVQVLLDAGAVLIGKTCTDELAFSLDGINMHYGTPHNPNLPGHIPGGSSSGSASAVAAGLCDFALGTDTIGSVRVPAAFCGIYGIRPTHGRVPTTGVVPLGPSFDTVGWFARTPGLLQVCASVLLGDFADKPSASTIVIVQDCLDILDEDLRPRFLTVVQRLSPVAASVTDVRLPSGSLERWADLFAIIRSHEAWQCHGQWLTEVDPAIAPPIKERFMACKNVTAQECAEARTKRAEVQALLAGMLTDAVFCLPTIWNWPPLATAPEAELAAHRRKNILLNTIASVGGLPQVTIPVRLNDGPRFDISFVAGPGRDEQLLSLALTVSEQLS